MHEKPWKEARWCNCLDAGRRRAPGVADLPGGAGRRHARDRGATARCRSTGGLPAALAGLTAGGRASPPAAGAWPPGRTRPSAARPVNVETPVAAAICRSVCPAASSPAIRAASAGVSFDAPFGPGRTGTSPATPPQASAWSHRQMVAGSTPNASATWPCDAARSRTSCTAPAGGPRRPRHPRRRRPARAPRPARRPRRPAGSRPGRSRPPRAAAAGEEAG
jgi:hypothetical protein